MLVPQAFPEAGERPCSGGGQREDSGGKARVCQAVAGERPARFSEGTGEKQPRGLTSPFSGWMSLAEHSTNPACFLS